MEVNLKYKARRATCWVWYKKVRGVYVMRLGEDKAQAADALRYIVSCRIVDGCPISLRIPRVSMSNRFSILAWRF